MGQDGGRVTGPEDSIVTEKIKATFTGQLHEIARCFHGRLVGQEEAPSSWKIVKLVLLWKLDAYPQKRNQQLEGHRTDVEAACVQCNFYDWNEQKRT